MKCLESRAKDGVRKRRYRTEDGTTFWTIEIPLVVFKGAMNMNSFKRRMDSWQRAQAGRDKVAAAKRLIKLGKTSREIADEVGLSAGYVQRIRNAMEPQPTKGAPSASSIFQLASVLAQAGRRERSAGRADGRG